MNFIIHEIIETETNYQNYLKCIKEVTFKILKNFKGLLRSIERIESEKKG
jgi:hypothetical protein